MWVGVGRAGGGGYGGGSFKNSANQDQTAPF